MSLLLTAACASADTTDTDDDAQFVPEALDEPAPQEPDDDAGQEPADPLADEPAPQPDPDPPSLSIQELLDAPVPSLCGHPAGTLADGWLPGIGEGEGVLTFGSGTIEALRAGDDLGPRVARGDLSGDGVDEVAVIIQCNAGGVGLPDHVLVYGPGPTHLATFAPGDHDGQPGSRQFVQQITVEQGWLHLEWVGHQPGDGMAVPTLFITARARLDGGHLQVEDVEVVDERPTVRAALAAASTGDRDALAALAAPAAINVLLGAAQSGSFDDVITCSARGELGGRQPHTSAALGEDTVRVCEVGLAGSAGLAGHLILELESPVTGNWTIAQVASTVPLGAAVADSGSASGGASGSVIIERWGDYGPEVPLTDDPALGSGCRPGSDTLPDGVWFGYVDGLDASAVSFDLACMYLGDEAVARGADPEGFHMAIDNDSPVLRRIPLASEARILVFDTSQVSGSRLGFGPGQLDALRAHLTQRGWAFDWLSDRTSGVGVWVLVEDGELVELLESYVGFVS